MAKRMLIDAAHPEETRVVVLNGNRLEEFDFETSTKKQIKGNIYLAKVTRVEPSLQAAFVEYGGNRHGFLAFNEIHPDYYRIPVADRQAALEAERVAEHAANAREDATRGTASADEHASRAPESEPSAPTTSPAEEHDEADDRRADGARRADRTRPPSDEPHRRARAMAAGRGAASRITPRLGDARTSPSRRATRSRRLPTSRQPTRTTARHATPSAAKNSRRAPRRAPGDGADRRGQSSPTATAARTAETDRDRRRRRARGGDAAARPPLSPLQDPGSHQAPPDHAGAGDQGRARQQGRGADDLSLARRPLLRADAEHAARRRRVAQDHQCRRPPAPQGPDERSRSAGRHGRHRPHRRQRALQGRDQARFRISAAAVGRDPRPDPQIDRAGAHLRGRQPHQALDPRPLCARHRGSAWSTARKAIAPPRPS